MLCCGRSGSLLLQSFLDSHPEILQIPTIFKFFDFYNFLKEKEIPFEKKYISKAFVEFKGHEALFDSDKSIHLSNRLGENKNESIKVSKKKFIENFESLRTYNIKDPRELLISLHLAYDNAWRNSKNDHQKVLLMHLHHGDWLNPEKLIEKYNLSTVSNNYLQSLMPDKILFAIRNPLDCLKSVEKIAYSNSQLCAQEQYEIYMRLLVQDWLRLQAFHRRGLKIKVIKLEELRLNQEKIISCIADWLNISGASQSLNKITLFGLPWWGDFYSRTTASLHPPEPPILPNSNNPDHVFVYSLISEQILRQGYPLLESSDMHNRFSQMHRLEPPNYLWHTSKSDWEKIIETRKDFRERVLNNG